MADQRARDENLRGEEAIIALLAPLTEGLPGAFGLKDDCALLTPAPGTELVLKTDPIAEGVHFLPGDAPQDIAWKALAVNVSDLAAKGAAPLGYLMALSFPQAPDGWMPRFADGLQGAQAHFGCHLMGGDTDRRPGPLTISITIIGSVPRGSMVRRTTARAGDAVFVSGTIGDAGLGLALRRSRLAALGLSAAEADICAAATASRAAPGAGRSAARICLRRHGHLGRARQGPRPDAARSGVAGRAGRRRRAPVRGRPRASCAAAERLAQFITAGDDYEVLAAVPRTKPRLRGRGRCCRYPRGPHRRDPAGPPALTVKGPDGRPLALPERTGWDHF